MRTGAVITISGATEIYAWAHRGNASMKMSIEKRMVQTLQSVGIKDIVLVHSLSNRDQEELQKELSHSSVAFLEAGPGARETDLIRAGEEYLADRCDVIVFWPEAYPFINKEEIEKLLDGGEKRIHLKGENISNREEFLEKIEKQNQQMVSAQVKVWIAREAAIVGPGTLNLFRQIRTLSSVRDACKKCGISYSKGWTIIRRTEEELGYSIVDRQTGGKNGGQAAMNEKGEELLRLYEEFAARVEKAAQEIFQEVFKDTDLF